MTDPIAPLINALHAEGRLRVWSLVITVFGDLVQCRGGAITTTRLGRIMGRIGVEQGALRTALSRLGQDGWVTSTRSGRISIYRLSPDGLAQIGPATSRIYAAPRIAPVTDWRLCVSLDGKGLPRLRPADEPAPPGEADLRLTGHLDTLSDAWRTAALAEDHRAMLLALDADLTALESLPAEADPLTFAVARMLLIHRWRRLVLRHDEVPAELMPPDMPRANPRADVARAYARLCAGAEAWMDLSGEDLAPMPAAGEALAKRFGSVEET